MRFILSVALCLGLVGTASATCGVQRVAVQKQFVQKQFVQQVHVPVQQQVIVQKVVQQKFVQPIVRRVEFVEVPGYQVEQVFVPQRVQFQNQHSVQRFVNPDRVNVQVGRLNLRVR